MEILSLSFLPVYAIAAAWGSKKLSVLLPEKHLVFERKPFNCRPCLSFHIFWMSTTAYAIVFQYLIFLVAGILSAFILFFTLKYIDNKKIEK